MIDKHRNPLLRWRTGERSAIWFYGNFATMPAVEIVAVIDDDRVAWSFAGTKPLCLMDNWCRTQEEAEAKGRALAESRIKELQDQIRAIEEIWFVAKEPTP